MSGFVWVFFHIDLYSMFVYIYVHLQYVRELNIDMLV